MSVKAGQAQLIVLTPSTAHGAALWPVWAALAVAMTSAAGVVFGYGLARWADLSSLRPIRVRDVVVPVVGLLAVTVLTVLVGVALTVTARRADTGWSAFRGWALVSVAVLGAVPAVAVMYGIRHIAGGGPTAGMRGEQAKRSEDRGKLELLVGADRSVFADLQTGLAILGPLIASATTAFLPH